MISSALPRGHDPVGQRLHRGRAVDVGDRLKLSAVVAEHFLVAGELVGRTAVGEAAAGLQIGQQDALVGLSILAVSAMKWTPQKTIVGVVTVVAARASLQAVAGEVGQFLDLAVLVVMGQDRGVLFFLEFADFGGDVVNDGGGHDQRSLFFRWRRNNPRGVGLSPLLRSIL